MTDQTPAAGTKPRSLKLEFSKAADLPRIEHALSPEAKKNYDPNGYLARRLTWAFNEAVATGGAAFLSDEHGKIQTLTMAYHTHVSDTPAPGQIHDYTEMGTSFATMPGFNSSKLIIAALVLHEYFYNPPAKETVAFIKSDNIPSQKIYRDSLGWKEVEDGPGKNEAIITTDKTLSGSPASDPSSVEEKLYRLNHASLVLHACVLLEFMKQGGLINKKTGEFIPVDFSALDQAGLTRARLESVAQGSLQP